MRAGMGEEARVSEQRGGREEAEGPLLKLGTHPVPSGEPRLCPRGPASGLLVHRVVAKVILPIQTSAFLCGRAADTQKDSGHLKSNRGAAGKAWGSPDPGSICPASCLPDL